MRIFWALNEEQLAALAQGVDLSLANQMATAVTPGFPATVETNDQDELDLLASLSCLDLHDNCGVIAALDVDAELVDDDLGEVSFSGDVSLADVGCFMIADIDSEELSWFGIQEVQEVLAAVRKK
jgi:hypothetical protein